MKQKKAQAAFEYLVTYGWAIMAAIILVGALAYFGILNPSNLLPSKCDFGKQLECVEYKIIRTSSTTTDVDLILRNNFGKDIQITQISGVDLSVTSWKPTAPVDLSAGSKTEFNITISNPVAAGEKKEMGFVIIFNRVGSTNKHNVTGMVFATVQ